MKNINYNNNFFVKNYNNYLNDIKNLFRLNLNFIKFICIIKMYKGIKPSLKYVKFIIICQIQT